MNDAIPIRCRRVVAALRGELGHTPFTAAHRKFRNIDLQQLTGQSCADRKLRQLREVCPGLIREEEVKGQAGSKFKLFWISAGDDQGTLF